MQMNQFAAYFLVSVILVLLAQLLGKAIYPFIDEWLSRPKDRHRFKSLDRLIKSREMYLRGYEQQAKTNSLEPAQNESQVGESDPAPSLLKEIYQYQLERKRDESDQDYFGRLFQELDIKIKLEDFLQDKNLFKRTKRKIIMMFHPDHWRVESLPESARDRATKKIHRNYLVITEALTVLEDWIDQHLKIPKQK